MGLHSTLCSYLNKLLWLLTGNFANGGGQYIPTSVVPLAGSGSRAGSGGGRRSPVADAPIISGLVPCNVIAEEILTDHPDRYRAMLVESANPVHSLADSPRMREALAALDFVVVIDVAMTETAQLADYVLPASSQFEKWEATFFNFEFPNNYFHLRRPVLDALPGTLPEPEIHARIVEALGVLDGVDLTPLHAAAEDRRAQFGAAVAAFMAKHAELAPLAPVILYRTLGPALSGGAASAAVLWAAAHQCARNNRPSLERAGFSGEGAELGEALFDAILTSPSGVTFSVDDHRDSWQRVRTPGGLLNVHIDVLVDALAALGERAAAGFRPRLPARAVGRRAALVHRQRHLPRPQLAQARRRRRLADLVERRRRPRTRRRRRRRADDQTGERPGDGRDHPDDARRARFTAQRPRRQRDARRRGRRRRAERAHL